MQQLRVGQRPGVDRADMVEDRLLALRLVDRRLRLALQLADRLGRLRALG